MVATAVARSEVRSDALSTARAAASTCSIACTGVGGGNSGSTMVGGSAKAERVRSNRPGLLAARRSAIASSSSDNICRTSA